ncbi:MAG: methyltransferase domain-containing protein [Candidatus Omnitrophota bacterium]|nr:methyltransferase domain-containing protein [Candidatus Omnitrophota bacterium]
MDNAIEQGRNRLKLFKKYGYDIPRARNFILAKAGLSKGKILEIGTGKGHMTVVLAKKGFRLISIDLDRKAQNIARMHLKSIKCSSSVILKIMDAEQLRYKDNSFDYVISVNFIHHAKNPGRCLKEMIRVTKNRLIIADINKRGERIMEKVHRLDGHSHEISKMSLKEMEALLKKIGIKVNVYKDTCQTVLIARKGVSK